jgi:hypothetical protein
VDKKAIYWTFVISVQKCDPPHNLRQPGSMPQNGVL